MSNAPNIDQIAYWNSDVGNRWVREQERLDRMLATVSSALFAAAKIQRGERVLDVGCGCGDTSLQAAKLGAQVLGADVSEPMLALATRRAAVASNPQFVLADASTHPFEAQAFDVLLSRFGVMFFADPIAAFTNLRKAMKPSGRVVFACWREPRENEWVRVPVGAARPHVPPQAPLGPDDPGPFAFADPARVTRILANAGFDEIALKPVDVKLEMGATLDEAVAHIQEFGPVSRLLTGASDLEKSRAVAAIGEALAPFARETPVKLGASVWLVSARP